MKKQNLKDATDDTNFVVEYRYIHPVYRDLIIKRSGLSEAVLAKAGEEFSEMYSQYLEGDLMFPPRDAFEGFLNMLHEDSAPYSEDVVGDLCTLKLSQYVYSYAWHANEIAKKVLVDGEGNDMTILNLATGQVQKVSKLIRGEAAAKVAKKCISFAKDMSEDSADIPFELKGRDIPARQTEFAKSILSKSIAAGFGGEK